MWRSTDSTAHFVNAGFVGVQMEKKWMEGRSNEIYNDIVMRNQKYFEPQ